MEFKIDIPTDSEGFYSLNCPHCSERFKAQGGDMDSEEVYELFCPSCGLIADKSKFLPPEIIDHAETLAANYAEQEIYKSLKKTGLKLKGSGIKMKLNKPKEKAPQILTEDENLEQVNLICCNKIIKVNIDHKLSNVFCPFCGVN
ncbi:hypothetical protein AB9M93_26175 [Peribacillus frigoritolerans]|uniref:hypothetical protein n=1 Tax=Peribacillus frigoritolerans TaxID=450367 RepID=UPI003515FA90